MNHAEVARTEAAFREVNEAIASTAARFDSDDADLVCECADPVCAHRLKANLAAYEVIRADATHFIVAHGHDEPDFERVIARHPGYLVVEKFGDTVSRIVRALDPRANPA